MRYKFRYFSSFFKFANAIVVPFQNFILVRMLCALLFYLLGRFSVLIGVEDYLFNDTILSFFTEIAFVFSISSAIIYCVFRKGVFLNENNIIIARYTITPFNWKWWIKIDYSDIEKVNVNYFDLSYIDYHFRMLTLGGDRSYNVELTLKNGKKYYFSIEDQEEFCENLNQLIDNSKNR